MIHWKIPAISFAVGALATVGFVWLRSRQLRLPSAASPEKLPFDADETARSDALHDVGDAELDYAESSELESEPEATELRSYDEELFERVPGGERYDAVDPEDVGSEFLQRATQASVDSTPGSTPEPPDEPADVAALLPVGSIDQAGNTELHQPTRPEGAPAELSPTDGELEQRRLGREGRAGPDKPHE